MKKSQLNKVQVLRWENRLARSAILAVALLTVTVPARAGDPPASTQYKFTPLDFPGADAYGGTSAFAINNRGEILGNNGIDIPVGNTGFFVADGFIYEHGAFRDVGIAESLGATFVALAGVNERGTIAGFYEIDDENFNFISNNEFVRTPDGKMTFFPPLPVANANFVGLSVGINNQETLVSGYFVGDFITANMHGLILKHGQYSSYDYPGAHGTLLSAINDEDTILGRWFDASGNEYGFLLNKHGSLTAVEPLPLSALTSPRGLNNKGEVVGYYLGPDSMFHGFVLSHGVYTVLDFPGATDTEPFGINDRGEIVGTYNGGTAGFFATPVPGKH